MDSLFGILKEVISYNRGCFEVKRFAYGNCTQYTFDIGEVYFSLTKRLLKSPIAKFDLVIDGEDITNSLDRIEVKWLFDYVDKIHSHNIDNSLMSKLKGLL